MNALAVAPTAHLVQHTLHIPTHTVKSMSTSTYTAIDTLTCISTPTHYRTTAHLQCITMEWLPVLLWTLLTSSITSVTVFTLEQLPSGAQLVMWNWLTCCALPDCKGTQGTCHNLRVQPPSGTDLGILDTHSPQHKALQPLLPQQLHCELTIALGATAGPVLVAYLLYTKRKHSGFLYLYTIISSFLLILSTFSILTLHAI